MGCRAGQGVCGEAQRPGKLSSCMVIPPAPHPMAQTHQEALGKPKPPLFQPGGRGEAATHFGGRGDTTGTYFSRCRCQSCAREERWLCQLPSACNRLRFLLFIPRFELRHVAAEAFGSLRKGFIASFLTSAQTSTSLAWGWVFFPPCITLPSALFSSWPSLCSCHLSVEWDGELRGGDLLQPRLFCRRRELVQTFFSATCKDVQAQGLVLHHSIHSHVLTPRLQTKPPPPTAIACTPVPKTCSLSDTWHTQPHFTIKAPKPGLENQSWRPRACDSPQPART